ncbi:MAG: polysaccharide biosynthesis protein [Firmicutes bacterium]|nr:polysaccharide biosynthesis protein [Bacillota bacterium]
MKGETNISTENSINAASVMEVTTDTAKKDFLKGASVLTIAGMVVKLLGGAYRIPLTNIIGAEGIGLYQLVYPVFSLILIVSSAGLPVAISKFVAESYAIGNEEECTFVYRCTRYLLYALGAVGSIILFVFAKSLAAIQGNSDIALLFMAIAPSVLLVAIISSIRGYFQGRQKMLPTALSQIIEQFFKIAAGLTLAIILLPYGVMWAAFGAVAAVTISEVLAFVFLQVWIIVYKKKRNLTPKTQRLLSAKQNSAKQKANGKHEIAKIDNSKNCNVVPTTAKTTATNCNAEPTTSCAKKENRQRYFTCYKRVLRLALPITLGAIILPLTQFVDSILIVNTLTRQGYTVSTATKAYGVFAGGVSSLISFPTVVTLAIAVSVVPAIAAALTLNKKEQANEKITTAVKIAFLLALPMFVVFTFAAQNIVELTYSKLTSEEQLLAIALLRVSSKTLFYMALLQVFVAVLQGINRPYTPLIALSIGLVIKVILTIILLRIPTIHIFGASISTAISLAISCIICLFMLRRYTGFYFKNKMLALKTVASIIPLALIIIYLPRLLTFSLEHITSHATLIAIISTVTSLMLGIATYAALILFSKCFTKDELEALPLGNFLSKMVYKTKE